MNESHMKIIAAALRTYVNPTVIWIGEDARIGFRFGVECGEGVVRWGVAYTGDHGATLHTQREPVSCKQLMDGHHNITFTGYAL